MREVSGDIWSFHDQGFWTVVTTNGYVKRNGEAVLGAGIAKQAVERWPTLPKELGAKLLRGGNHVYVFPQKRIITFPVKHNFYEEADLLLIWRSAKEIVGAANAIRNMYEHVDARIVSVRPGCANGKREWSEVRPVVESYFDTAEIVIVDRAA